jgi:DNA-binding response OmpR family regulator
MKDVEKGAKEQRDATILVVEDDKSLREGLAMNFQLQGYRVVTAANGDDGMRMAFDERPDLIVLDVMLPGWSGLEILSEIRAKAQDVPVLILSARSKTEHKLEGFDVGADDYVTKPFELPELLARAEALLRRGRRTAEPPVRFGDVELDPMRRTVTVRGEQVALSARELDLLLLLAGASLHARDDSRPDLGVGLRRHRADRRQLHHGAAPEDRGRSLAAAAHQDRPAGRLQAGLLIRMPSEDGAMNLPRAGPSWYHVWS